MGEVYLALDTKVDDREVAVKMLHPDRAATAAIALARERRALVDLGHDDIIRVFNYGHHPGVGDFLVLQYVDGLTLEEVRARAKLNPGEFGDQRFHEFVLAYGVRILSALAYLHAGRPGKVYGDLKPDNVMHDGTTTKIIDVGSVRPAGAPGMTTAGFSAPTVGPNGESGQRDDLFSLGETLRRLSGLGTSAADLRRLGDLGRLGPVEGEGGGGASGEAGSASVRAAEVAQAAGGALSAAERARVAGEALAAGETPTETPSETPTVREALSGAGEPGREERPGEGGGPVVGEGPDVVGDPTPAERKAAQDPDVGKALRPGEPVGEEPGQTAPPASPQTRHDPRPPDPGPGLARTADDGDTRPVAHRPDDKDPRPAARPVGCGEAPGAGVPAAKEAKEAKEAWVPGDATAPVPRGLGLLSLARVLHRATLAVPAGRFADAREMEQQLRGVFRELRSLRTGAETFEPSPLFLQSPYALDGALGSAPPLAHWAAPRSSLPVRPARPRRGRPAPARAAARPPRRASRRAEPTRRRRPGGPAPAHR
ncbi:serine/threonine protein kinase [Streptomyces canus]